MFKFALETTKWLLAEKGLPIAEPDKGGWIPLHYAAYNGYLEITKLLLEKDRKNNYTFEISKIFIFNRQYLLQKEIERRLEKFVHGKALRTVSLTSEPEEIKKDVTQGNDRNTKDARDSPTENKKRITKDIMEYIKDAREAHLVVATLIATVAFTAGLTMPGGHKDNGDRDKGAPVLMGRRAFQAFIIADTMAMLLSCLAIFIHLFMALGKKKATVYKQFDIALISTIDAMFAMMVAFITGTYAVLYHHPGLSIPAATLCGLFFLICYYIPSDWKGLPDKIEIGKNPPPSQEEHLRDRFLKKWIQN